MKNLNKSVQYFLLLFIVCITSCQKEVLDESFKANNNEVPDYVITDGIVHFKDYKSFIQTIENIRQSPFNERIEFGAKDGFKSFLSYYADSMEEMDSAKQDGTSNKYVRVENGFASINFVTPSIAAVANKEGLIFVGKSLMRFVDDKEVLVKDGDISKAMNWNLIRDSSVVVAETDNEKVEDSHARSPTLCRQLQGTQGANSIYGDGSIIRTKVKRIHVALGSNDQYGVYFFVYTKCEFNNSAPFDGSSSNNTLKNVYACDIYDFNNNVVTVSQMSNVYTSYGQTLEHEDPGIYAGQCFSFQVRYYYANFRPGEFNPLPGTPCSVGNCQYIYPVYINDKHTVNSGCTGDTTNE